jgi:hypothetical protein
VGARNEKNEMEKRRNQTEKVLDRTRIYTCVIVTLTFELMASKSKAVNNKAHTVSGTNLTNVGSFLFIILITLL